MKRLTKKTTDILVTLLLAVVIFSCMWIVYNRGVEEGQNTFSIERFKPDTTGLVTELIMTGYGAEDVIALEMTDNVRHYGLLTKLPPGEPYDKLGSSLQSVP